MPVSEAGEYAVEVSKSILYCQAAGNVDLMLAENFRQCSDGRTLRGIAFRIFVSRPIIPLSLKTRENRGTRGLSQRYSTQVSSLSPAGTTYPENGAPAGTKSDPSYAAQGAGDTRVS